MLRLLLDEHVSPAVAVGVAAQRPMCTIRSVNAWRGGAHRAAPDAEILGAAYQEGLTLVTYDQETIPALLAEWGLEGWRRAGVVFVSQKTIRSGDMGGLIRALAYLWDTRGYEDWTDVVDYLGRSP